MNKIIRNIFVVVLISACNNNAKAPDQVSNDNQVEISSQLRSIQFPGDSLSAEPYLFSDNNGLVYLSWIEKKADQSLLKFSVRSGEQWSEPVEISSGNNWFVNWADYPLLASDGNQNMLAHFLEKSEKGTYNYDVKLTSSSDKGKTWTQPKILHDDGKKAEHGFVSITPFGEQFFVSWLDGRNTVAEKGETVHDGHHGQMSIRGALINKKNVKTREWELDNRVCDCCQTSATITTNGPVVVYRDRSEDEIRDISIVRLLNDQWTKPKPVFKDNWKIAGCPVNGPRADAIGNNLAVVWFSSPDKKGQVHIIFSGDGGEIFDNPIRVDEGNTIGRVDVVMIDEKSAMASWMDGPAIKAVQIFRDGTKRSSINIATSSAGRAAGFPQMSRSGNNLVFAWTDEKEKRIKLASISLTD
ncbi:MAG: sialidase family protein [Chitinophagaceae bacterium]